MKKNIITVDQLEAMSNKIVTYYYCKYDTYGQRTGEYESCECSQLEYDIMRMNGDAVYLDPLMAQRIALS